MMWNCIYCYDVLAFECDRDWGSFSSKEAVLSIRSAGNRDGLDEHAPNLVMLGRIGLYAPAVARISVPIR